MPEYYDSSRKMNQTCCFQWREPKRKVKLNEDLEGNGNTNKQNPKMNYV